MNEATLTTNCTNYTNCLRRNSRALTKFVKSSPAIVHTRSDSSPPVCGLQSEHGRTVPGLSVSKAESGGQQLPHAETKNATREDFIPRVRRFGFLVDRHINLW